MKLIDALRALLPRSRPSLQVLSISNRPARLTALLVPTPIANATVRHLRAAGEQGCEEFAFWTGHVVAGSVGLVGRAFHPQSTHSRGHVLVDDDAQLLAMTDLIHGRDELVLCQLHTHPAEAWHSPADDAGAFTDEAGFLSLVLPRFAEGGLETAEAFRRTDVRWIHEGRALESGLVQTFGDVLCYHQARWRDA
jgi:hypothetical protein